MTHLKVLIVDDLVDPREALRLTLQEESDWEVHAQGFENVGATLERFRPDMVVLDLKDAQTGRGAGNRSFDEITKEWFCPVIVYSAVPEMQEFDRHPLVATIKKGSGTDETVRRRLEDFIPQAEMIKGVHRDFDARIREALRKSVHYLRKQVRATDDSPDNTVLRRAVRRLVAAQVDAKASGEGKLQAWERFVVPPLGHHLLTADLLRREDAEWTDQEAFRLVLTPSCDLAGGGDREPKVDHVLVARCEPLSGLGDVQLPQSKRLKSKTRSKVKSILTEGMADNHLPIPRFRDHVPLMRANLKRLELIGLNDIRPNSVGTVEATGAVQFKRVASTDSPFREVVVWAYLRVTGRPGMPDFDVEGWLDDISEWTEGTEQS